MSLHRARSRLIVDGLVVAALSGGCGIPSASPVPPPPTTSIENCGTAVPADAPPDRVFAAFHNAVEAVYALGAGDRLVGAAYLDNSLLPEFAGRFRPEEQKPAYFPEEYPGREEVLRLDPDFVVAGFTGAFTSQGLGTRAELADIGIDSYLFTQYCPTADGEGQTSLTDVDVSFDGVYRNLRNLGRLLGATPAAEQLVARMQQSIADTEGRLTDATGHPRVAMVNSPASGEIRVFGTGDIATTIIEAAGGIQVFDDVPGRLTRIGTEELIARSPDVVVVPACCGADVVAADAQPMIDRLRADPALANVPAVRDNRIYGVTFAEITPGVRVGDAVANLARVLHPERF
jgi:iron complex transport system substrate-binding protein